MASQTKPPLPSKEFPLDEASDSDFGGGGLPVLTMVISGTDLADFNSAKVTPPPAQYNPDAAPFDLDFNLQGSGYIPADVWVKIVIEIDPNLKAKFDKSEKSLSAGNAFSQTVMRIGKNAQPRQAVLYVHNVKKPNPTDEFVFNIGLVLGNGKWAMPVLIDPKVGGTGGGG